MLFLCINCGRRFERPAAWVPNPQEPTCGHFCKKLWAFKKKGQPPRFRCHLGPLNPHWRGGRSLGRKPYVRIRCPQHPCADMTGRVPEHVLVMESMIGRFLCPAEVVHHRNRDTRDNRPENLMLCGSWREHMAVHREMDAMEGWKVAHPAQRVRAAFRPKTEIGGH